MITNANLEAALRLVRDGWIVFPCKPDKSPYTAHGVYSASCNEVQVSAWWEQWPDALPALPCGVNGLCVVDCDRKDTGIDGVANFQAGCAASCIDISTAFAVDTPSGGRHYYFRVGGAAVGNTVSKLGPGIDTRGAGGYVIAPEAVLPDGRVYQPVQGALRGVLALPRAIGEFLAASHTQALPAADPAQATGADHAYALSALRDEYAKLCATTCNRNNALNIAAHSLGTFVGNGTLNEADVVSALLEACMQNRYTQKPDGTKRAIATIYSGLKSGKSKPRTLPSQAPVHPALPQKGKKAAPQATPKKQRVALARMAEVSEEPITWLWSSFLPLGKLTLLAGAGGTGKSTLAFSMASIVSTGAHWPDNTRCNVAGNVLIWSSEDDAADVIKPRLLAMNADVNRIGMIQATKTEAGDEMRFDPARDMDSLKEAANAIGGVSLLIIDPIVSAVSGDMHKANDVRRSLQAIVDFAAEMNCAVVGITHFAKSTTGRNPAERVIGSQAFAAFARMVLVAAKDEDTDNRVFTRAKSNISIDDGGFNYTIQEVTLPSGIKTTRILWGVPIDGSARNILATVEKSDSPDDKRPALKEAKQFLHEELKNGARMANELIALAKSIGISEITLKRAKVQLGIEAKSSGYQGAWMWSYPFKVEDVKPGALFAASPEQGK